MPVIASAHCQIPCGIYDDKARFTLLNEHITTIEKSMKLITELSAEGEKNHNQIVRWVTNKEDHAQQFMDIVTAYFMAQRIKPVDPADAAAHGEYLKKVELLHQMLVSAMKCKQTTDKKHTEKLKKLVTDFEKLYMGE
jgi:nickel superoxide dismutase